MAKEDVDVRVSIARMGVCFDPDKVLRLGYRMSGIELEGVGFREPPNPVSDPIGYGPWIMDQDRRRRFIDMVANNLAHALTEALCPRLS